MKPRAPSKSPVPGVPETRLIQPDPGKEIHFVKMPNFLSFVHLSRIVNAFYSKQMSEK